MHPDIYGPDHPYRKVSLRFWKVVYLVIALCFVALGVFLLLDLLNVREIR